MGSSSKCVLKWHKFYSTAHNIACFCMQVRGPLGLLDSMERFVEAVEEAHGVSPVVVMGSVQLTSNVFNYVVGSITLSAIRRLSGTPVVVVTANSKQVGVGLCIR